MAIPLSFMGVVGMHTVGPDTDNIKESVLLSDLTGYFKMFM